jgi:hypothetical protein
MAAHPGHPTDTQAEQDDLDRLGAELVTRGYHAQLATPHGRLPYLDVRNPQAAVMSEHIYAQADAFFWPWAEPIAGRGQISAAADIITRVLRVITPGPP